VDERSERGVVMYVVAIGKKEIVCGEEYGGWDIGVGVIVSF
jgi:hypothetical protein